MARLAAQAKLLFYPTDPGLVETLASWFKVEKQARIVDPCCGKGDALALFASRFDPKPVTSGIEISYSRSAEAAQKLDLVLTTSFYDVSSDANWSPRSVGLVFNNPPYDWSHLEEMTKFGNRRHIRHEREFIERSTPKIVPGGHHIIIIPRAMLGGEELLGSGSEDRIARHLLGWFEKVIVCRADNDDWKRFSQVVVLALNKRAEYAHPTKEEMAAITQYAADDIEIPIIQPGNGEFVIPPIPDGKFVFTYKPNDPNEIVRLGKLNSPLKTPEYERLVYVRPLGAPFRPATPLKIGHISMLISGQETGILRLTDESGKAIAVKGMARKVADTTAKDNFNEEGEHTSTSVTQKERHVVTLAIVREDGKTELLDDSAKVGKFITDHADEIADAILDKNKPLYDYLPGEEELSELKGVGVGLPPLPGRKERGLFLTQKHFAIGAKRVLHEYKSTIINAEMGFGKTSTTVGILTIMKAWPALVWCPGHMTQKWARDIRIAADPERPITPRIITRPTLDSYPVSNPTEEQIKDEQLFPMGNGIYLAKAPRWFWIKKEIEQLGGEVVETHRSQVEPECTNDPGMRRRVVVKCADATAYNKLVALFMKQSFKDKEKTIAPTVLSSTDAKTGLLSMNVAYCDRDEYTLKDFYDDYKAGLLGERAAAICGFEPVKYDSGWDKTQPGVIYRTKRVRPDENSRKTILRKIACCSYCGAIVEDLLGNDKIAHHECSHVLEKNGKPKAEQSIDRKTALYNFTRWRRVGLARLIQKQYSHFFKICIADEIHKAKSGTTDIGVADQRLISSIPYNVALTGTLFGGAAGSLFYLLYRRVPEVRKLYEFDDIFRWVDHYGLWEMSWSQNERIVEGMGASTGVRRVGFRRRELPGIAPGAIRFLLPITLFGNITDLGYELPPLYEDVVALDMLPNQAKQYSEASKFILNAAVHLAQTSHDPGGLSVWFNTVRYRPASAFRAERVHYESKKSEAVIDFPLPPVIDMGQPWLPKERKLAEIVRANMEKNRKTLVFVEQTGTRDIRERIELALKNLVPGGKVHLVEVGSLSASDMAPVKRELWIKHNTPGMNAMLVNPKLVETGLDLVMFSDLVFYETTTSLYTLWQAMRRVWRLGQASDVQVTFLAYKGTMEEIILDRMGKKMKYAQLLYGESASGVLVDDSGDDDMQREIIRDALQGKAFASVGETIQHIFGTGAERTQRINTEPQGSMIAASPVVTVVELPGGEAAQISLFPGFLPAQGIKKRKLKSKAAPSGQISFWGLG